jgi:hypothetical protein
MEDHHEYLPAVSDHGPGYVETFGRADLQTLFYQAIFHSEGDFQSNYQHSLAFCKHHLIIGHIQAGRLEDRHGAPKQ